MPAIVSYAYDIRDFSKALLAVLRLIEIINFMILESLHTSLVLLHRQIMADFLHLQLLTPR